MESSTAIRVQFSLADAAVKRLIVCLSCGDRRGDGARGALGSRVAQQLLDTCAPSPSDIHNPDTNRLHARDASGRARQQCSWRRREQFFKGAKGAGPAWRHGGTRNAQTWDSERVVDYMGVWCDRLLLGEHTNPSRCALLEPRVPPIMLAESLERVLQALRGFRAADVLFVFASCCAPFGAMRLVPFSDELVTFPLGGPAAYRHDSLGAVLQRLAGPPAAASALLLGIGAENGPLAPLAAEESAAVSSRIVPLAGFTSALWTVNPAKASEYLESNPKDNVRLWRTMQMSMLSTRDTALLRAYESGRPLDARMSQQHTKYLAETLLSRLFPDHGEN
ncbi:hypothetical protein DQ04_00331220 [Trypanosoma grayi]|uniref:hypothetical protein n=1 Tax=Trypanosoma grayi TaxID=71804 RepID=UPI0004F44E0B|nr:hypothetical protein DQ04_00331220 [Trypanosoma grayi]KEG14729.1 hypothetical protein DQ04_00331220 [Trypanosoma grayi]